MSEEITYSAVEKNGVVTAIWEMRGRRHLRTIDPRSQEGQRLLENYQQTPETAETETVETSEEAEASETVSS
jgi:DNA-binding PadR family transcriptional regulator